MKNDSKSRKRVQYTIEINAPKEKVWDTMLNDETYREWTSAFSEGSHFKGNWQEGSKILFLDPSGAGMIAKIERNKPYEFMSIEHLGFLRDGEEDTESQEAKVFAGAHENYTLKERNGVTELLIDIDLTDEYKEMFDKLWPNALSKLKALAER